MASELTTMQKSLYRLPGMKSLDIPYIRNTAKENRK